jgi:hypothetical protein
MAQLNQPFVEAELPKSERNFEPLPAGWYTATIGGAEVKATKAGTGEYIAVRYDITGPSHQGRVVFGNLNIKNANPTAEAIGYQQMGELMRAIGLPRIDDTDQLVGGQLQVKLDVRKSEQYGDSNDVKAFKSLSGGAMPIAAASAAPKAPAKATPPWVKK